jgi:hypothetical protein
VRSARTRDKAHGRRETRVIETTSVLEGYIDRPGAKQFAKITRYRTVRGKRSREVEYLITSLPPERAGPEELLRLRRAHWGVENRLFCVRDVSFHEDQCRVRTGSGPEAFAAIRNTVITFLRRLGFTNIAAGLRHFMMNYRQAISLVRHGRIE